MSSELDFSSLFARRRAGNRNYSGSHGFFKSSGLDPKLSISWASRDLLATNIFSWM